MHVRGKSGANGGLLRERFLKGGAQGLADQELLAFVISHAVRKDDPLALSRRLLARFGGFARVAAASPEELMAVEGCGPAAAAAIKAVQAAAQAMLKPRLRAHSVLSQNGEVERYLRAAMAAAPREQFRVLFLNAKNALIADEVMNDGTVNQTAVYPREVARRALEFSASAVLLAHNHPSGDPTPSREDVVMTARVVAACDAVGVTVHDHLVVAAQGCASLRTLGLM